MFAAAGEDRGLSYLAWIAAAVMLGLMASGVTPFEGPWKWAVFALVLAAGAAREHRRIWVIRSR